MHCLTYGYIYTWDPLVIFLVLNKWWRPPGGERAYMEKAVAWMGRHLEWEGRRWIRMTERERRRRRIFYGHVEKTEIIVGRQSNESSYI